MRMVTSDEGERLSEPYRQPTTKADYRVMTEEDIAPAVANPGKRGLHPNRQGYDKITRDLLRAFQVLPVRPRSRASLPQPLNKTTASHVR